MLEVSINESRYDRQERVSWWDQTRLSQARVLVVGAGALGNEIVKNLVLVGIAEIVVVDMDTVEASNLARCVFFRAGDEGLSKAELIAARATELNPDVKITGIVADIRSFGTGVAWRCDVIVGALDNREARLYLNRLAARTRRAWVDGAIESLQGVARVFQPPGSCYECTLTDTDWQALSHRQSCRLLSIDDMVSGKVPTTASTSSIVAGLEAQEVVKLLHRDVPGVASLRGGLVFDGGNNDTYTIEYPVLEDCMAHHHYDDSIALRLDTTGWQSITAADIAAAAWSRLASDSPDQIILDLGDDHVVAWRCTACDSEGNDGRPVTLVGRGESLCACGEPRMPTILSAIEVPGPYSATPLASLGVRADEALISRRGLEEQAVWLAIPDERLPCTWSHPAGVAWGTPEAVTHVG